MTAATMALDLLRRGLSVIPVPRPDATHDGKVPALAWKPYQTRRATEAEVVAWFETEQNIAVITGAVSNAVVVDADSPEAERWLVRHLPRTPWQVRTARGLHAYYRHPGVPVRNRAKVETRDGKLALDVRGDGGYVIGPGSVHASGHVYLMGGDWSVPLASLPMFWVGWLARPAAVAPVRPSGPRPTGDVADRARRYLAAIPRPVIGQGSDAATFSAAARLIRGFELDVETAVSLLVEWAPADFDVEWIRGKVECAARYATEPIGGLR